MPVLSDKEILKLMENGEIVIDPYRQECLNPAGYDVRSALNVEITPNQQVLIASLERIELGLSIAASIHIRSSLAREGIVGSFALVDPGFRGQLTLSLYNAGRSIVKIAKSERVAQLVFYRLGQPASKGYRGAYQDSFGVTRSKRLGKTF